MMNPYNLGLDNKDLISYYNDDSIGKLRYFSQINFRLTIYLLNDDNNLCSHFSFWIFPIF